MVSVNGYVNYGSAGICKVESISPLDFQKNSKELYYTLIPVFQNNSKVYVPADKKELVSKMREILSKEEIDKLILDVKNQSLRWNPCYKARIDQFHDILFRRDERELLMLISCLYIRNKEAEKGLTPGDVRVMKLAEDIIKKEFAFSLNISEEEVDNYIKNKLGIR